MHFFIKQLFYSINTTKPFVNLGVSHLGLIRIATSYPGIGSNTYGLQISDDLYADVLLLYAEALNKTSASSDAVGYINKVRARASVSMPALDLGLSPEKVLEAIIHERRVELCLEGKSGFDLRRLLSQSELVNYFHNKGYTNFSYPRDLFLPIPQSEIDKSDGSLEQNPSWK